jgi:plastocyanin
VCFLAILVATASIPTARTEAPAPAEEPATAPAGLLAAADADDGAEISILEPPFKPPQTWAYEPTELTVKAGTPVTWINNGAVVHTVTADDGKTFNSGDMGPKASFSFTANSAGTFAYHCTYHPWMKGTVTVQP